MAKRTWKVSCSWECYGVGYVEAETLEEAIKIAEEDDFPLPTESHYVDASFEVDPDMSKLLSTEPDVV